MSEPITVVGAGPAGAALAAYLGRAGHNVTVYESRSDLRSVDLQGGRSINLALAARGIAVLEELGAMEAVEPLLIPMRGRMIHDLDGTQTLQPYGSRPEEVIHSVSRSELNGVLLDAADASGDVTILFNQRCVGGDLATGELRLHDSLTDTEYDIDAGVVFGADGFASEVRRLIQDRNDGTESVEALGHGYKELTLPAAADGSHRIDPNALHIWPRGEFMLIALADTPGSFTCTLFAPSESGPHNLASLDSKQAVINLFTTEFPDFVPLVPDLAEQFLANLVGQLGTLRCDGWQFADRAIVVGDAAHAIVPFHGQGMNAALESCKVLAACLGEFPDDWGEAFATFERIRKPDTDAIADMAIDNYLEMRSEVRDPGYQLRRELALELERRFPEQFTPRYSMVMFNTMPYAEALRRAQAQAEVLRDLTAGADSLEDVDFGRAAELIASLGV